VLLLLLLLVVQGQSLRDHAEEALACVRGCMCVMHVRGACSCASACVCLRAFVCVSMCARARACVLSMCACVWFRLTSPTVKYTVPVSAPRCSGTVGGPPPVPSSGTPPEG
jgi:hypothetical protein